MLCPSFSFTITSPATTGSSAPTRANEGEVAACESAGCTGSGTSEQAASDSAAAAARTAWNRPLSGAKDIDDFLLDGSNHRASEVTGGESSTSRRLDAPDCGAGQGAATRASTRA